MRLVIFFLTLTSLAHFGFSPDSLPYAQPQNCPTVHVTCPDTYELNKPMTFTANVSGVAPNVKLVYKWQVSAGKIVEGQDTSSIKVDMSEQGESYITATVEVEGFAPECGNKASCTLNYHAPRLSRWFDQYGNLRFRDEKARLSNFAIQLRNEPGAQGYIIVYAGRDDNAGTAQARAGQAKSYLIKEQELESGRIVTVDGGVREKFEVELWVVPAGAIPPTPRPTVPPSEIQKEKEPDR